MQESYIGWILISGLLSGITVYGICRRKSEKLKGEFDQLSHEYVTLSQNYQRVSKQYLTLKEHQGETQRLLEENQKLRVTVDALQNENTLIRAKQDQFNRQVAMDNKRSKEDEKMLKEMLKYARDLSHPDKGGSNERFVRYHKAYTRYLKQS